MENTILTQPEKPQHPTASGHRVMLAVLALAVVAIAAGTYLAFGGSSKNKTAVSTAKKPEKGLYNQTISVGSTTFKLPGATSSAGLSFPQPKQYKLAFESDAKDQFSLTDTIDKGNQHPYLGAIIGQVAKVEGVSGDLAASYRKVFASPSSEAYKNDVDSMHQFAISRMSPIYDIKFSQPRVLSSKFLTTAWVMDLNASPKAVQPAGLPAGKTASVTNSQLEDYKGWLVFAVGKSNLYYFAAYNTSYNWDNNDAQFANLIYNFRIDQ